MKKFITLAVMLMTMIAGYSAKTIWEGYAAFAEWQLVDGDRPVFEAALFRDILPGDKMQVYCTLNEECTVGWPQVELYSPNVGVEGETPVAYGASAPLTMWTTMIEITFTSKILDYINEYGGVALAGTGYIATKVDLVGGDGTIWEGTCTILGWQCNPPVQIPGGTFAAAKAGNNLVFDVVIIDPNLWAAVELVAMYTEIPWATGLLGQNVVVAGQDKVVITLTQEMVDELQAYGISLTGDNVAVTKIYLENNDVVIDENTIWVGSHTVADWNPALSLDAAKFENIKAGDALKFTVKDVPAGGGTVAVKQSADWADMPSDIENGCYLPVEEGDSEVTFALNAEAVEILKASGAVIVGQFFTLSRIDLVPDGAGINSVAADKTANEAIYNLQGIRVNGNNLPAGIYVKSGHKIFVK